MWQQIAVIAWAQFRTMRNHFPRTTAGTILGWIVSLLWYGLFAVLGVLLAIALPKLSLDQLRAWIPVGLLGVFFLWQLVPLFTLSSGWSLQVSKLLIYPVPSSSLFGVEVVLRITSAPEMILLLSGGALGLARNPELSAWPPLVMWLLFIPFNLFLSLGIRELVLQLFQRKGFREVFTVVLVGIMLLPQLLLSGRHRMAPQVLRFARSHLLPSHSFADLALGYRALFNLLQMLAWIVAAYLLARWQFERSLTQEDTLRFGSSVASLRTPANKLSLGQQLAELPSRWFKDPLGALLQKEFQSLLRMPRFRVIFGMACVFSVMIFIPMVLNLRELGSDSFIKNNFLAVVTLYGVLMMSDSLLLNVFGFDRRAAQIYFVTPVPLATVLRAKNLTAITFIFLQSLFVLLLATLVRATITPLNILDALSASAVVGIFLLCVGNLTSIAMARPSDPTQTFRRQAGGKMQLWLMLCSLGMFLLVGFGFLARWALRNDWAYLGVMAVEFCIGLIVYHVAIQSALERAMRDRERMLEALSKNMSPVALG
jgi:ABC-2 type transport system permease protein